MIKFLKPLIYFILSFFALFLVLLILYKFSLVSTLTFFSKNYIYFYMLFTTLYFFLNHRSDISILILLSLFSFFLTILFTEVIYPKILKDNISLPLSNDLKSLKKSNEMGIIVKENIVPIGYKEKSIFFLEKGEWSSALVYADMALEVNSEDEELNRIKSSAEAGLKKLKKDSNNEKYIDILVYRNLINQNRILDAYYFSLNRIQNSVYDHDFLIKLESCLQLLLEDYYSIDVVSEVLKKPGYSDIKFYYTKNSVTLYTIEKLVELDGEIFMQNIYINDDFYPYLYINNKGKIYSSGFRENRELVYNYSTPFFPLDNEDVKLFSQEMYKLSKSSLIFSFKIFNMSYIKYFKESKLSNLIISTLTSYLSIFTIFLMTFFYMKDRDYLNYFFVYSVSLLSLRWFIKKIGLLLLYYGIGLSLGFILLVYIIWWIILIKKVNPVHALS